jgi:predicted O-methyltransferase YrrM
MLKDKEVRVLEIGTYAGTSLINIMERIPNSVGVAIDRWENYEELYNSMVIDILKNMRQNEIEKIYHSNIEKANLKDRIETMKGDSVDKLCELIEKKREFDLIYVDGSHLAYDCYIDSVLSWKILAKGGIMIIDDYLYKTNEQVDERERPYQGVNEFLEKYKGKYEVLNISYRVFIRKL